MTSRSYYLERRYKLLCSISGAARPHCETCGWAGPSSKLHVHHIAQEHGQRSGGWQALLQYEKDLRNGVPLMILCFSCHNKVHDGRLWSPEKT